MHQNGSLFMRSTAGPIFAKIFQENRENLKKIKKISRKLLKIYENSRKINRNSRKFNENIYSCHSIHCLLKQTNRFFVISDFWFAFYIVEDIRLKKLFFLECVEHLDDLLHREFNLWLHLTKLHCDFRSY